MLNIRSLIIFTGLLFCSYGLINTKSRAGFLGMFFAIIVLFFARIGKINFAKKMFLSFSLIVILIFVFPWIPSRIMDRSRSTLVDDDKKVYSSGQFEASAQNRVLLYKKCLEIIPDHPLLGIGFGEERFKSTVEEYGGEGIGVYDIPHNLYLEIAVFMGIPSLIVFLVLLYAYLKSFLFQYKKVDLYRYQILGFLNLSFFSGISATLISSFFSYDIFSHYISPTFWLLMGLNISFQRELLDFRQK